MFVDCMSMTPDAGVVLANDIPGVPGALLIENLVPQAGPGRCAVPKGPTTTAITGTAGEQMYVARQMELQPQLIYSAGPDRIAVWNQTAATYNSTLKTGMGYASAPAWQIVEFGNNMIAVPNDPSYAIPPQIRVAHAGACADLESPVPATLIYPRCAGVVRNHLFFGNILYGGTTYAQRVAWSARDNARDFAPSISTRAGYVDLVDDYGSIRAIMGGSNAIVFKSQGIHRFDFVGGETVWEQQQLSTGVGTLSPHSLVELAGDIYFRARDGFYVLKGRQGSPIPIGEGTVWNTPIRLANQGVYGPWTDGDGDPGLTSSRMASKWQAYLMEGCGVVVFRYDEGAGGEVHLCYHPSSDRWAVVRYGNGAGGVYTPRWYFNNNYGDSSGTGLSAAADLLASTTPGKDVSALDYTGGAPVIVNPGSNDDPDVIDASLRVISKVVQAPAPARLLAVRPRVGAVWPNAIESLFPVGSVKVRYSDQAWGNADDNSDANNYVASIALDADGWHSFDPVTTAFVQLKWEVVGEDHPSNLSQLHAFYGFELRWEGQEGAGRDARGS